MRPVHDVMGITPPLWPVTAGEATSPIPDHHGTADPRRDHRVRRPTSSGSDAPLVMTRLTEASQARRRAASEEIGPTSSSSAPEPGVGRRPSRVCRSTVTVTWGRSPPTRGRSVLSSHCLQISPSASARRCGGVRTSSCDRTSGIADGPKGGDDRLPGLGIQVSVHPDHARERRGDVQASSFVRLIGELRTPGVLGGPAPGSDDPSEVWDRQRGCRLHEVVLGLCKGLRIDLVCGHQHIDGRRGDLAFLQSLAG